MSPCKSTQRESGKRQTKFFLFGMIMRADPLLHNYHFLSAKFNWLKSFQKIWINY